MDSPNYYGKLWVLLNIPAVQGALIQCYSDWRNGDKNPASARTLSTVLNSYVDFQNKPVSPPFDVYTFNRLFSQFFEEESHHTGKAIYENFGRYVRELYVKNNPSIAVEAAKRSFEVSLMRTLVTEEPELATALENYANVRAQTATPSAISKAELILSRLLYRSIHKATEDNGLREETVQDLHSIYHKLFVEAVAQSLAHNPEQTQTIDHILKTFAADQSVFSPVELVQDRRIKECVVALALARRYMPGEEKYIEGVGLALYESVRGYCNEKKIPDDKVPEFNDFIEKVIERVIKDTHERYYLTPFDRQKLLPNIAMEIIFGNDIPPNEMNSINANTHGGR